jgi:hypothetical protein
MHVHKRVPMQQGRVSDWLVLNDRSLSNGMFRALGKYRAIGSPAPLFWTSAVGFVSTYLPANRLCPCINFLKKSPLRVWPEVASSKNFMN